MEADYLWDLNQQKLIWRDDQYRMLHYRDLKGPSGQLFLAKTTADHQWIWQANLSEMVEHPKIKSPKLVLSTQNGQWLFVLVQDYKEHAHLALVAMDLLTGEKVWSLKI
ncbi:MAG: hypothetical protein AAF598_17485 [Bacteroidota bacterium]